MLLSTPPHHQRPLQTSTSPPRNILPTQQEKKRGQLQGTNCHLCDSTLHLQLASTLTEETNSCTGLRVSPPPPPLSAPVLTNNSPPPPHPAGAFLLLPQGALLLCSFQLPSSLVLLFTAECLERGFCKDYHCFLSPFTPTSSPEAPVSPGSKCLESRACNPRLSIISCCTHSTHCFSSAHEHPSASSLHPTGFSQQPGMAGARVIRNDFPGRDF